MTEDKDTELETTPKSKEEIEESMLKLKDHDEITKELKSIFSLPKYGLKNRTMTVMARIDKRTSKILDALVALELTPSRSSAAAFLIVDAIKKDKEKYAKILESYDAIKTAKERAKFSFLKSLQEEGEDSENEDWIKSLFNFNRYS